MNLERARTLELLGRRMELVRALIRLGAQWRRAFIELNLEQSERCAAEEEKLSLQIFDLDTEIALLEAARSPRIQPNPESREIRSAATAEQEPHTDRKIRDVLDRMKALHVELKQSNEVRKSILKRSEITLNALRNLFNSHAPTYATPTPHSTGTIYEERV